MITMADSIIPGNLPGGCPAYLVYADGLWRTEAAVRARFPRARLLTMTVFGWNAQGGIVIADGCDVESGDLAPAQAAQWARERLAAGAWRPVVYADASTMTAVLGALMTAGVARASVRLLSAHYGAGEHICGPATCKYPGLAAAMDGTQWTNTAPGLNGSLIDLSILNDDFFGGTSVTPIPLDIMGAYTNNAGDLFVIGTDADGVLHEVKRTAPGVFTAPYPIAGKVGA